MSLPLCCPSRATILTGQYAHNTGIYKNNLPTGGYSLFRENGLDQSTVAMALQNAGYRTSLMGKFMNGYSVDEEDPFIPPGWDDWHVFSNGPDYLKYQMNENGTIVTFGKTAEDYSTDVIAARANEFIRASADQPFFLYINPHAPHGPRRPASRHSALFADRGAPRTPAFNEPDVSDKPAWIGTRDELSTEELVSCVIS